MKTTFRPQAILIILLSVVLAACGAAPAQSWPGLTASGDTAYVAFNTHVYAVNTANGVKRWQFPPDNDNKISQFFSDPVLAGETLIVTSYNKSVYALDARDGSQKWVFSESTDRLIAPAAVLGESVYIASADNNLYALDLDGQLKWTFETQNGLWAAPLPTEEVVYVPSMDHNLYAVDAATGKQLWSVELNGALAGTPVLAGETLYIGTLSDTLYALNAGTGRELWTVKASGWVWASPRIDGDTLYFADLNGTVYSVAKDSGRINWQSEIDGAIRGTPLLIDGKVVVATDKQGTIYALNAADGLPAWPQGKVLDKDNKDRLLASLAVADGKILVAPLSAKYLTYALNPSDGSELWHFDANAK